MPALVAAAWSCAVAAESKTLVRSPTRMMGPPPMLTGPPFTLLVSSETTVTDFGRRPLFESSIAPMKPTSSARVKSPHALHCAPVDSSSRSIATMAVQPIRSSHARERMRPARISHAGRSHIRNAPNFFVAGFFFK